MIFFPTNKIKVRYFNFKIKFRFTLKMNKLVESTMWGVK